MANQLNQPKLGALQEGADEKIILNPRLPKMAETPQTTIDIKGVQMPKAPAVHAPAGGAVMAAFDRAKVIKERPVVRAVEDMKAHPEIASKEVTGQSYIRLRVRAAGDRLTVLDVHEVDGPLVVSPNVAGEHAYEVQLDSKSLNAEGILDVGVSRSFPRPGSNEHFITPRSSFDFNVRIPKASLPDSAIPRLSITLYQFPDASPKLIQGRISAQTGLQAKAIARLPALNVESLEPNVTEKFQKIFPKLVVPLK
jgi:hypothetical protein